MYRRTLCHAHCLHSKCKVNQVFINVFRGAVRVNVALDHYLQKGGHQHRAWPASSARVV